MLKPLPTEKTVPAEGAALAARAFLDLAARAFALATQGCAASDSPFARARAALGEEEFERIATESLARHCGRVLGDAEIIACARTQPGLAADAAIVDVIAEVLQDVGRAAWAKAVRK